MRQPSRRPDGSVWVRTYPLTLHHDRAAPSHTHEWDQLTYAAAGVMHVRTADAHWLVPPHRAVWVPAGTPHAERMYKGVSVRTLYLAPKIAAKMPRTCQTVNVSSLLRELILQVSREGALDRRKPVHAHLIAVLLDQLASVAQVSLQLPLPRDPRAVRFADVLIAAPGVRLSVGEMARRAGGSRRTIERLFLQETSMSVGEWRRRLRLLHAVRLLSDGSSVTEAALDAGYASLSAFVAVFKKAFATTPGHYSMMRVT